MSTHLALPGRTTVTFTVSLMLGVVCTPESGAAASYCFMPGKGVFQVEGPPLACRDHGARWVKPVPGSAYPRMGDARPGDTGPIRYSGSGTPDQALAGDPMRAADNQAHAE